jgi:hypothetical protein
MPDFDAIGTALAARYAPAQVTPPTGYENIRSSTADLPTQMLPLPAVLAFLDEGSFRTGNGDRFGTHRWVLRFYYNQAGDIERDMTALRRWLTVLADQLRLSAQLAGVVTRCTLDSYRIGIMRYAGLDYTGIEFGVSLVTTEGWGAVA